MKICTIRDIAQLAGVSVTTVSRVLNHRPDVNKETRERVERVMAENHFVGNANARGLKQTDSDLVAIILRGNRNSFLNAVAEALLRYSRNTKAAYMVEFIDEKADEFETALRLSHEKRVNGFIFVGSRIDDRALVLKGLDVPMVFSTVSAAGCLLPTAASVAVDDRAMGKRAMNILLAAGHRKIAIFGGCQLVGDSLSLRAEGCRDALQEAGLPFDEDLYRESRFSLAGGYQTAKAFFPTHPEVTAVFAMSDNMAMGVVRALREMGKQVPEDVSVVGFDGLEMGRYFIPALTTIEQPVEDIARSTIEVLADMMERGAPPRQVTVEAALMERESVRAL